MKKWTMNSSEEEDNLHISKISHSDAMKSIDTVMDWFCQQDDVPCSGSYLSSLKILKEMAAKKRLKGLKQQKLNF